MTMCNAILALLLGPLAGLAQQTVAPTPDPAGPARGDNTAGYNIVNSFETGYRFVSVHGDSGKYRSDVNFGNGIRLLGGSLVVHSRDGHGGLFDEIALRTAGLGNDPYQFTSLRVEKNRLYRYDLLWRLDRYWNPALTIADGLHSLDTTRRLQDHNLTLFPQSAVKVLVGYTRNSQDGTAFSTVNQFDIRGGIFPLFADVERLRNEYRLGGEFNFFGVRFTALRGWDNFSETTPYSLAETAGGPPNGLTRTEPYTGSSPYWRLNLRKEDKRWALGARYSYAGTRRSFLFDETASGLDRFGAARNRQIVVTGDGSRPLSAGDVTVSVFPASTLTFTDQLSFHNTRMNGNGAYQELNNATLGTAFTTFQFLGVRLIANTADVTWQAAPWIGLYGGYNYSSRRIRSVEDNVEARQENHLNAGLAGLRLRPVKPLTLNLDAEVGRNDRPFTPLSERNYHALGARLLYKAKTVTMSLSARSNYNNNPVTLSVHSARGRNYSANAGWTPRGWLTLDATYSKIHLDTVSGIAYFASGALVTGDRSIYVSNLHFGNVMAQFALGKRIGLGVGYSRVQDLGDGRSQPAGNQGGASLPSFLFAQTFPLSFESPLARFSLKLHERLRWNVGYQFYHYGEKFSLLQNYRAHTGYTSLSWSF